MLKTGLKRSAKHNEDGSMPELLSRDLGRNLDDVDTKMETTEVEEMNEDDAQDPAEEVIDPEAEIEDDAEEVIENPEEEIPDHLETDLEEPEETFKDINEKVVVYLYRGFAELQDNVRVFVEDIENEERDPELVEELQGFMENIPEVMDHVKELAKKYVTTIELFDPEEEEEVTEPEVEIEDDAEEVIEPEAEDAEALESYIKTNNLEHNVFESEYEVYARYSSKEEADKYESELKNFKGAEVFRHEDIGEIHAFIRVK